MKFFLMPSISLIITVLTLQCQAYTVKEILVHEPVTFLCNCTGNRSVVLWTRFIPIHANIGKCYNQTCQTEQNCPKRFAISEDTKRDNFSMRISSAAYNDAGSYRCTCDGNPVTEVKLRVYVPTVVKAFERENVTLPCYGNTQQGAKDVTWMKAGQKILVYTHENKSQLTEKALADRCMMSAEDFLDGELSLHISSVHQSDAGIYRCLINNEAKEGNPHTVLLKVEGPQLIPTNDNVVIVLAVLLGLLIFVGFIGIIFSTVKRCNGPHAHTNPIL